MVQYPNRVDTLFGVIREDDKEETIHRCCLKTIV